MFRAIPKKIFHHLHEHSGMGVVNGLHRLEDEDLKLTRKPQGLPFTQLRDTPFLSMSDSDKETTASSSSDSDYGPAMATFGFQTPPDSPGVSSVPSPRVDSLAVQTHKLTSGYSSAKFRSLSKHSTRFSNTFLSNSGPRFMRDKRSLSPRLHRKSNKLKPLKTVLPPVHPEQQQQQQQQQQHRHHHHHLAATTTVVSMNPTEINELACARHSLSLLTNSVRVPYPTLINDSLTMDCIESKNSILSNVALSKLKAMHRQGETVGVGNVFDGSRMNGSSHREYQTRKQARAIEYETFAANNAVPQAMDSEGVDLNTAAHDIARKLVNWSESVSVIKDHGATVAAAAAATEDATSATHVALTEEEEALHAAFPHWAGITSLSNEMSLSSDESDSGSEGELSDSFESIQL